MCLFSARNFTWLAAERHKGDMFWITYSTVCSSGCSNCRQFVVGSPWPVRFSTVFQPALDQHQHFRGSNICFTVSKIINIPWHSAFLNHYFNSADYHGNRERVDLVYQPHTNCLKYRLHTNHILTTHKLSCGHIHLPSVGCDFKPLMGDCCIRRLHTNHTPTIVPTYFTDHIQPKSTCSLFNNYSPKWRWIAVDIYRAASAR